MVFQKIVVFVCMCVWEMQVWVCACARLCLCVCICVAFAWFTLMLYKDIIILLHGSHKLNVFYHALYWVRTSMHCCKITFSNDERKFTFHEKSNSSWTAELKTIKEIQRRNNEHNMYLSCEKCADKKALQQSALIAFPISALVTSSKPILYTHPEGDPL